MALVVLPKPRSISFERGDKAFNLTDAAGA